VHQLFYRSIVVDRDALKRRYQLTRANSEIAEGSWIGGQNLSYVSATRARMPIQKTRQILAQKHLARVQVQCHLIAPGDVFRKTIYGTFIDTHFYPRAFACGTIRILPSFFG
jgi:hypothetical protein